MCACKNEKVGNMKELLKSIFTKYKIEFIDEQINMLDEFYQLVISWNENINLTAITDKKEFAYKHILDCVLPYKYFKENAKIIDVGAGAGFPSIPLKIMRPDLDVLMLDSLNKRVKFLEIVIGKLRLKNIKAKHDRAEDAALNFVHREKFDYAVARAVASMSTLSEYLLPFVKIGGEMVAYKSVQAESEISEAKRAFNILGGRHKNTLKYTIQEISSERNVVVVWKVNSTPNGYPRGKNKPKTNPL